MNEIAFVVLVPEPQGPVRLSIHLSIHLLIHLPILSNGIFKHHGPSRSWFTCVIHIGHLLSINRIHQLHDDRDDDHYPPMASLSLSLSCSLLLPPLSPLSLMSLTDAPHGTGRKPVHHDGRCQQGGGC